MREYLEVRSVYVGAGKTGRVVTAELNGANPSRALYLPAGATLTVHADEAQDWLEAWEFHCRSYHHDSKRLYIPIEFGSLERFSFDDLVIKPE